MGKSQGDMIADFVEKSRVYAVIGASSDPTKYGNKIFRDLKFAGYETIPVHPSGGELDGVKRYKSLAEIPSNMMPDVIDIVVPPSVTEKVVVEAKKAGIKRVWMQPGSESETAIKYCADNEIDCLHDCCVMVNRL